MPINAFENYKPLADRLRPRDINEVAGQRQLLSPNKPLRIAIESGKLHSMVFWGPPGTGKTTLAKLLAAQSDADDTNSASLCTASNFAKVVLPVPGGPQNTIECNLPLSIAILSGLFGDSNCR